MKKICLKCNNDFEAKKDTAKFCSASCRVMHHQKHGKKNKVTPVEVTLINMKEVMASMASLLEKYSSVEALPIAIERDMLSNEQSLTKGIIPHVGKKENVSDCLKPNVGGNEKQKKEHKKELSSFEIMRNKKLGIK